MFFVKQISSIGEVEGVFDIMYLADYIKLLCKYQTVYLVYIIRSQTRRILLDF